MIQEPALVQGTTYYETPISGDLNYQNENTYLPDCKSLPARTKRTASWTGTTIPIIINTHPNPRIILIKVPAAYGQSSSPSNQSQQSSNPSNQSSQSNNNCNRAEPIAPRTRLIRIPFLPGPVPTPSSVKLASPTTNVSVSYTTPATASPIAKQTTTQTGIIYPHERYSSSLYSQLNQVASDQIPTPLVGPPTLPTKLVTPITTPTATVKVSCPSQSQTLAAMAGIQLTGADMESRQDMSGAMPTATVEEIDVPVFIDEYLQNIEASSSTSCSGKSEENGKEICTETDIIDFDFDINLFAEDLLERKEMDQCNLDLDVNYSENSDNIDNLTGMDELKFPQLLEEGEEEALNMGDYFNGIEINLEDQIDLNSILTRSENPMLSNFSQGPLISNSQTKFIDELPLLADENSTDNIYACSQNSLGFGLGQVEATNDVQVGLSVQDAHTTLGVGAKRSASIAGLVTKVEHMPQKRNKLILNINKSLNTQSETMNTPDIIEQVLDFVELNSANTITQDRINYELRNTEETNASTSIVDYSPPNTPYSAYSVSTSNSHSYAATSQLTAPVSPAFSNASTSQFSATTSTSGGASKRKRGRPAKEHSDGPDPEVMSRMTPEELKQYCDRMKNNEASRISRRKTKKREDEEKQEEDLLQEENVRLTARLNRVLDRKKRHEVRLMQLHHRNSTYVKPEPEH